MSVSAIDIGRSWCSPKNLSTARYLGCSCARTVCSSSSRWDLDPIPILVYERFHLRKYRRLFKRPRELLLHYPLLHVIRPVLSSPSAAQGNTSCSNKRPALIHYGDHCSLDCLSSYRYASRPLHARLASYLMLFAR